MTLSTSPTNHRCINVKSRSVFRGNCHFWARKSWRVWTNNVTTSVFFQKRNFKATGKLDLRRNSKFWWNFLHEACIKHLPRTRLMIYNSLPSVLWLLLLPATKTEIAFSRPYFDIKWLNENIEIMINCMVMTRLSIDFNDFGFIMSETSKGIKNWRR